MDRIAINNLRVRGKHGANPGEKETAQPFDIDVIVELDLHAAQSSDDLTDTLDYAALRDRIATIVQSTSYNLLERLAGDVLTAIFEDQRVTRAEVTIAKPELLGGATPSITLKRDRPS